jgi:N-acetylneuraminic acid mutarotase
MIYAVAGLAGSATANEIYDPGSDRWIFGADFPTATDHAWAVAFEGLLYVGGGTSNRAFSYDPATDAWTEIASSSHFHGGTPAAAVLGGRIVVAGGAGKGTSVGGH